MIEENRFLKLTNFNFTLKFSNNHLVVFNRRSSKKKECWEIFEQIQR